ncbi:uncharacterized protein J3R85_006149 [Psidium guajava]|nr:uncharacterized protein J3R85_006149 [Psidium guajava]
MMVGFCRGKCSSALVYWKLMGASEKLGFVMVESG